MPRQLSEVEVNRLAKYGLDGGDLARFGQTPVEYITGWAEFCGREFMVSKDTLIPRVETQEIIGMVTSHCNQQKKYVLADVGTGCGCVGITLALGLKTKGVKFEIWLSDFLKKTLMVARKNARNFFGENHNIKIVQSNLLKNYPAGLLFDIVVANLPYIPSGRISRLPVSVRKFEPKKALDGGANGTTVINRLIRQFPARLKPHGLAILEIDDTHKLSDFEISREFRGKIKRDQFGRKRFLLLTR